MPIIRTAALFAGPLVSAIVALAMLHNESPWPAAVTAAVTIWCALWWILEAVPLPVTALLPLAVFPATGVLSMVDASESYGNKIVLLMLGGFMLSKAMERSGAHRRIALGIIRLVGDSNSRRVIWGFMIATALLSMWMSNAATALMMLPVALAISPPSPRFQSRILLGIAYASSIGGLGTPIGTPPNLIFLEVYREYTGITVSFFQWMLWAVPVVALMIPCAAFSLTRDLPSEPLPEFPPLPPWSAMERRVLIVFGMAAALWMTRTNPWGGWSTFLQCPEADDATIALLATIVLFVVPSGDGGKLLDWPTASQIQWGILILFGGGIAIAKAFVASGLSASIGSAMVGIAHWPTLLTMATVCFCVTFVTEITSNTATASLLMPVLAAAAMGAGMEPTILMVPAIFSVSFAFMLPVATPPNAIVMAGGNVRVGEMAREGLILNLVGVVVVTTVCYALFR